MRVQISHPVRVTLTALALAVLTPFAGAAIPSASADAAPCSGHTVVADAADGGEGLTVTVSLAGACEVADLTVFADAEVLVTREFTDAGTAEVTFVPTSGVEYRFEVPGVVDAVVVSP